jgi:hypothetical protein
MLTSVGVCGVELVPPAPFACAGAVVVVVVAGAAVVVVTEADVDVDVAGCWVATTRVVEVVVAGWCVPGARVVVDPWSGCEEDVPAGGDALFAAEGPLPQPARRTANMPSVAPALATAPCPRRIPIFFRRRRECPFWAPGSGLWAASLIESGKIAGLHNLDGPPPNRHLHVGALLHLGGGRRRWRWS